MNPHAPTAPLWMTASSLAELSDDTLQVDLSALELHVQRCKPLMSGRWFRLQCGAEAVRGFMASRLMTSLLVMGVLLSLGLIAL
jgi:hypothetical protein